MLVLTRKKAESIKIGNDIVVTVIQTGKGTVRLGIQAPANVRVLRGELAPFPVAETETDHHADLAEEAALDRFLAELNDLLGSTETTEERLPLVAEAAL
ncbi:MAG TPA: carbon storage regulator [Planctomycetaceae bacterium]|nr:carbon storage regulator [Planctomycetaceae bacterium]